MSFVKPGSRLLLRAAVCIVVVTLSGAPGFSQDSAATTKGGRVAWTTSRIKGSPYPTAPYRVKRVFPNLSFENPVIMTDAPHTRRLFVGELSGKIFSFDPTQKSPQRQLVIDLKASVKGFDRLYGLTFHPQAAENNYCYICYVGKEQVEDGTRVSRFRLKPGNTPKVDPSSEEVIIRWPSGGHNGGCLKFGPKDGYLYITAGDGGPAFPPDPRKTGQDVSDLLAGVMRINVDRPAGNGKLYSVPSDNPFVGLKKARPEVWAFGMRNPWKMTFDQQTGDLWIGDVGWELWEMIYRVRRGGNYGWSLVEGRQPVHEERPRGPTPVLLPAVEHSHIESRSITGGHVYRGKRLKGLRGQYIYGDYVTGKIWSVHAQGDGASKPRELAESRLQVICFGQDRSGEVFVVDYQGGVYQLEPNAASTTNRLFPRRLSETGLFASVKDYKLAAGVRPYELIAEPWADGALADRFVALPGNSRLDIHAKQNVWIGAVKGEWKFPDGAVLGKTLSLEVNVGDATSRRRLETQILLMDGEEWRPFNYIWNEEQTDAILSDGGGYDRQFVIQDSSRPGPGRQQTWHFASRSECLTCHTTRGGVVYGFRMGQLDRSTLATGGKNQLDDMAQQGYFIQPLPKNRKPLANPHDETASLGRRARSYLHVNCAHCHRRGGGGTAAMDISIEKTLKATNLLEARPTQGAFDIHGAEVFAQGDPYRTVIYYRMLKLGRGRMPHIGSYRVDSAGAALIHRWVSSFEDKGRASVTALRKTQAALLQRLKKGGPERSQAVTELLSSTSGALQAITLLEQAGLTADARRDVIAAGTKHAAPQVRDLFERYVPEDQRVKKLGVAVKPEDILKLPGNAARGRELFLRGNGIQCRSCHQLENVGKDIGPSLKSVGKKNKRSQLLESLLLPSKTIDPKFTSYVVETTQGRVHTGLLARKTEREVVLKGTDAKLTVIPASEVELMVPQRKSLMPDLLLRDMTAQQVADLLSYLESLRQ